MMRVATERELEDLYDSEYPEWLYSNSDRPIGNGTQLILLMEQRYMWEEFLDSLGLCEQ